MALFRNDSPGALTMEQGIARATQILEKEARRLEGVKKARAQAAARDRKAARMAEQVAAEGRGNDTEVAHVTPGEMVIPRAFQTAEVLAALAKVAAAHGVPLDRFRVGSAHNSINPTTGAPEFIFDDTWHGAVQLPSITNALANAGNTMLSGADGRGVSSWMADFDRWAASTPINIDYAGAGLSGIASPPQVNAPYRYDGPAVGEITITTPRATNPPYSGGQYVPRPEDSFPMGDLQLPGGDTVSGNLERTRRELEVWRNAGQFVGSGPRPFGRSGGTNAGHGGGDGAVG